MHILVQRPPASRQGPDISDPLLTAEPVAVERGRNEIDKNCSSRQIVTLEVAPLALRINTLVEVQDVSGSSWRGLVTGIRISQTNGEGVAMTLTLEREAV
jgi:hypothetical protein